jgi:hypothetical protein
MSKDLNVLSRNEDSETQLLKGHFLNKWIINHKLKICWAILTKISKKYIIKRAKMEIRMLLAK